jgi:hypothetical protein
VKIHEENEVTQLNRYSDGLRAGGEWSTSRFSRFVPRNSRQYLLYRRLNWLQSWRGRNGEEKDLLPLSRIEPRIRGRSAHGQVAVSTELSLLFKLKFNFVILSK